MSFPSSASQTTYLSKEWCRTAAYCIFPASPSFLQLLHHHKQHRNHAEQLHISIHMYCSVLHSVDPTRSRQALNRACCPGHAVSPARSDANSLCSTSVVFRNDIWLFGALGICNTRRRNNKVDLKLVQYTHSETKVARTWCIIFSYHSLSCYGKCSNEEKSWLVS